MTPLVFSTMRNGMAKHKKCVWWLCPLQSDVFVDVRGLELYPSAIVQLPIEVSRRFDPMNFDQDGSWTWPFSNGGVRVTLFALDTGRICHLSGVNFHIMRLLPEGNYGHGKPFETIVKDWSYFVVRKPLPPSAFTSLYAYTRESHTHHTPL